MSSSFVAPTAPVPWRVDVAALGNWLIERWGEVAHDGDGGGPRAYLWTLPDFSEVWVPEGLDVVWMDCDVEALAAIGVWCAARSSYPLWLSDEGLGNPIELTGIDEAAVIEALEAS